MDRVKSGCNMLCAASTQLLKILRFKRECITKPQDYATGFASVAQIPIANIGFFKIY
jgi:hypothetical protein